MAQIRKGDRLWHSGFGEMTAVSDEWWSEQIGAPVVTAATYCGQRMTVGTRFLVAPCPICGGVAEGHTCCPPGEPRIARCPRCQELAVGDHVCADMEV